MMLKNIIGSVKSATSVGEETARTVYLAGLGAYSKGMEQKQQTQGLLSNQFRALVDKGEYVEAENKQRIDSTKKVVLGNVEKQVNYVIRRTSGIDRTKLSGLEERIDTLTAAVDKLLQK
jgi:hypothetical protein